MNHIAAIHILKAKLQLCDADYRALLLNLTDKDSCKAMGDKDLQAVRSHMHKLALVSGVSNPVIPAKARTRAPTGKTKKVLEPLEKKVWALWYSLEEAGTVQRAASSQARAKALRAYVARQTGMTDMAFCNNEQLNSLVESLKQWRYRAGDTGQ